MEGFPVALIIISSLFSSQLKDAIDIGFGPSFFINIAGSLFSDDTCKVLISLLGFSLSLFSFDIASNEFI